MSTRISTAQFYNHAASRISANQSDLYQTQNQISAGKRILVPSDDPIGAAAASVAKDKIAQNDAFSSAISAARSRVDLGASKAQSVVDILQRVNELAVQSRNGSYQAQDLVGIGKEISALASQLGDLANSQDGQGNYMFSGSKDQTPPYALDAAGYTYQGDQTQSFVRTGPGAVTQTGWSGVSMFQSFFAGDGAVNATAASSNGGNVYAGEINEQSTGSYDGAPYKINFTALPSGQVQVSVINATTNATVVAAQNYQEGMQLSFGGASTQLQGAPVAGDTIDVGPAARQNLLNVVRDLGQLLESAASKTKSQLADGLATGMRSTSNGLDSILTTMASMGAESNGLDFRQETIDSDQLALESERSSYEDLDYAKAASDLARQQTALQASLQSFAKISGLSLFNYLN